MLTSLVLIMIAVLSTLPMIASLAWCIHEAGERQAGRR